ncbi:malonyl CoA-ACP transacylase [Candidatus Magnetoovum chiemensis]|nr:malonyl CoA-ACP transacylase [Candidatus Magnetoovum chiemensis]
MTKKLAYVFPGQGSQYVGMGLDLYEKYSTAKDTFAKASDVLGYDIAQLCFYGPKEELNKTFRTQPCLLTVSMAAYNVLIERGLKPSMLAGHSLGEYSALAAAGVLSLKDALGLTHKRGAFMQEAVPVGKGLMAAIIGLDRDKVDDICLNLSSGYASPANYNCPNQIVIAGEKDAVEEAIKLAKEAGAKKAVPLAVSVPSHCALMIEASNRLADLLKTIEFKKPDIPIVNNADGMVLSSVDSIKSSLIRQLNSPLLWDDSIRTIIDSDIETFIEVGPGKALSGLIKRIDQNINIFNVEDSNTLENTVKNLNIY